MNWSESFVYDYLCNHSQNGNWKFFEVSDENGKTMPQAKFYSQYGYWWDSSTTVYNGGENPHYFDFKNRIKFLKWIKEQYINK